MNDSECKICGNPVFNHDHPYCYKHYRMKTKKGTLPVKKDKDPRGGNKPKKKKGFCYCGRKEYAKELCAYHCRKQSLIRKKKKCSIESCDNPHYARGYCHSHYNKLVYLPKREKRL